VCGCVTTTTTITITTTTTITITTTTTLTHFSTHLEIYNLFKKKMILKSLKGLPAP